MRRTGRGRDVVDERVDRGWFIVDQEEGAHRADTMDRVGDGVVGNRPTSHRGNGDAVRTSDL